MFRNHLTSFIYFQKCCTSFSHLIRPWLGFNTYSQAIFTTQKQLAMTKHRTKSWSIVVKWNKYWYLRKITKERNTTQWHLIKFRLQILIPNILCINKLWFVKLCCMTEAKEDTKDIVSNITFSLEIQSHHAVQTDRSCEAFICPALFLPDPNFIKYLTNKSWKLYTTCQLLSWKWPAFLLCLDSS